MNPIKTELGQRVLKDRSVQLTPRQRAAFILFDGRNSIKDVIAATGPAGVTESDVEHLIQLGLLDLATATALSRSTPASSETAASLETTAVGNAPAIARSAQQRYQDAYPIAAKLTASLGLRGFRLNLAVEHASSYEQLRDLAPRIRDAVGDKEFVALQRALSS